MRNFILKQFNKAMPPLSDSEREALEAGTVGWDKEILTGKPDWDVLMSLGDAKFTDEEQAFMDGPLQELCAMIDDWAIMNSEDQDLPAEIWEFMKNNKFFGLVISKDYNGLGFSALAHSEIVQTLASRSLTAAVTVMVPNSLGPGELLAHYGTQEQKDHYLPRLADGREIPCFGLTNPHAGSDAGGIPDTGTVFKDEDGSLKIRMNWEKRYITLGPVATVVGIAFKLEDPEGLLGDEGKEGITCALIPRDTPGVQIGERHRPMDIPFQNGPNWGKDVVVPIDTIIGGQKMAGSGWRMLMECLSIGRSISLPSLSVAGSKYAARTTGAYSRIRKQFKLAIGKFEGVEGTLASITGNAYMMDAARTATAQMIDRGEKPTIPSAIIKYHLTEKMRKGINDAMDIQAGKAVINGKSNLLSTIYQGIPIAITVEGANIMTRNLIIFGQGGVRAHPYLLKEMSAAAQEDKKKAAKDVTKYIVQHVGNVLMNSARSLWFGMSGGAFSKVPTQTKEAKKYYKRINRMCAAFNFTANTTFAIVGGGLKRKEHISARLGDVLSNIYLASSTLKHFETRGAHKDEVPLMQWACEEALFDAENALSELFDNYPNRFIGGFLRRMTMPFGRLHKKPSDRLSHKVAKAVLEPGELRDRVTSGIYVPDDVNEPIGELEDAFKKVIAAEPFEKKLARALHKGEPDPLTAEEHAIIKEADEARLRVITVDHYTPAKESNAFDSAKKAKAAKGKKAPTPAA